MLKKRVLGRTGVEVTEFGFGSWPLGGEGPIMHYGSVGEEQAVGVFRAYVEAGGNFIDTARAYNECERYLGTYFSKYGGREDLILATKTVAGASMETVPQIRKDLEQSLTLLKTDWVDILYLHQPPEDQEVIDKALDEMETLKKEGKIRALGASIKGVDVNPKTEALCRQYMATGRIDVIQLVYSILRQRHAAVIEEAYRQGVGIVARTALESGLLTGKYQPGHEFTGQDQRTRYNREKLDFILKTTQELMQSVVNPPYDSLAQVAIHFSLALEGVSSLIIGAKTVEQMQRNMQTAAKPALDGDLVRKLRQEYGDLTDKAAYS